MKKLNRVDLETTSKGITLIALVITIVVMLILAGVTINLTLGENGIFTTAQQAVKNYTDAQNKELAELNDFTNLLNNTINGTGNPSKDQNDEEDTDIIVLDGSWSEKNKVNMPKLENTGLTPVTINSDGSYGTADVQAENWYSYDGTTNKWANAKTKDGSMWVWIPRFAYKLDETNKTIDVVFLQDDTNKDYAGNDVTSIAYVDTNGNAGAYIVHPAFRDGSEKGLNNGYVNGEWDKEIPGFWMAKFEAGYVGEAGDADTATDSGVRYSTIYSWNGSTTEDFAKNYYGDRSAGENGTKIKYPTFQANRPSMNYIGIADAYKLCRSLQNATTVYGLTNIDTHMTKNSEWGAVAYLAYSKYGRSVAEVVLNNVSLNNSTETVYAVTGYAAESATGDNSKMVTTTWDEIKNGRQQGSWLTTQGQTASTTGNIYGIYDMSGGTLEWTSAYIATEGNYETYGGDLIGDSSKYKTKYEYAGTGEAPTANYEMIENLNRIGDAVAETSTSGSGTSAWNNDSSNFPSVGVPFFERGGGWGNTSDSGTFNFTGNHGYCNYFVGFRAVLVAE